MAMKKASNFKQTVPVGTQQANDEAAVRRQIDDHVKALCVMNLDDVMSIYAPGIVSFDIEPPLRYAGLESKRAAWAKAFAMLVPPLNYEIRDLHITLSREVAFSYSLNRMNAKLKNGHLTDFWLRWTACFKKTEGAWLIVHEQVSVPADFGSGRAVFDLSPD